MMLSLIDAGGTKERQGDGRVDGSWGIRVGKIGALCFEYLVSGIYKYHTLKVITEEYGIK